MTSTGCQRFVGKVAVITGSTAGIGLAIAERLGREGAKVVISSRRQEAVDLVVTELRKKAVNCTGVVCHVASPEHRQRLIDVAVKAYGKIDVLINNAVVNPTMASLLDTPASAIDKILDVNVKAALQLTQATVPHMPPNSAVLFVSSIAAYNPKAPLAMYGISKTALLGMVKALADELGGKGIRVNCLAPGFVPTKFSQALVASDKLREAQEQMTALGRLGKAEEIAAAAAFLVSDDASYVTAETLVAAGGMQSKL